MTVDAIKEAIAHLSSPERNHLAEWFDELREDEWDRQMAEDFSAGGRGAHLVDQVDRQIVAGNVTPLEEGLRLRRERRAVKK